MYIWQLCLKIKIKYETFKEETTIFVFLNELPLPFLEYNTSYDEFRDLEKALLKLKFRIMDHMNKDAINCMGDSLYGISDPSDGIPF